MPSFAIAPASLHRLRRRLQVADPQTTAALLQDAGFVTGDLLAQRWRDLVRRRTGLDEVAHLDREWFAPLLGELCTSLGWGTLEVSSADETQLLLTSADWAEADPDSSTHPSCHFSCGCLAAFLTALAEQPLAVLEVECRSRGDQVCRFLAGSRQTLAEVYDVLAAGRNWRDALAGPLPTTKSPSSPS